MALKAVLENLDSLDEALHELYTEKDGKFVLNPIEGLKPLSEFQVVHTALTKERESHRTTKQSLAAFEGLEPEEVRIKLDRIPELELAAAGKLDDKAIETIVSTRLVSKLAPVERERDRLKAERDQFQGQVNEFQTKEKQRVISDSVTSAARQMKVLDTAWDDAVLLGERIFEVDESGKVVTKENVGVTPGLTPDLWLTDMQAKRPHWWAPSQGGGANNGGGPMTGSNPFSAENWNMTEQGNLVRHDRSKAEKLAKQAGTTIGGQKPPARK